MRLPPPGLHDYRRSKPQDAELRSKQISQKVGQPGFQAPAQRIKIDSAELRSIRSNQLSQKGTFQPKADPKHSSSSRKSKSSKKRDPTPSNRSKKDEYLHAAHNFYGTPAVVETVYRKPKTFANLHAVDDGRKIARVPTAIGFHSMDSADEYDDRYEYREPPAEPEPEPVPEPVPEPEPPLVEDLVQASRSLEEAEEEEETTLKEEDTTVRDASEAVTQEEDEEEGTLVDEGSSKLDDGTMKIVETEQEDDEVEEEGEEIIKMESEFESKSEEAEEEEEVEEATVDEDPRYCRDAEGSKAPSLRLRNSHSIDSQSCPPIWNSFDEQSVSKHDHQWRMAEAKRVKKLNAVNIPSTILSDFEKSHVVRTLREEDVKSLRTLSRTKSKDTKSVKSYVSETDNSTLPSRQTTKKNAVARVGQKIRNFVGGRKTRHEPSVLGDRSKRSTDAVAKVKAPKTLQETKSVETKSTESKSIESKKSVTKEQTKAGSVQEERSHASSRRSKSTKSSVRSEKSRSVQSTPKEPVTKVPTAPPAVQASNSKGSAGSYQKRIVLDDHEGIRSEFDAALGASRTDSLIKDEKEMPPPPGMESQSSRQRTGSMSSRDSATELDQNSSVDHSLENDDTMKEEVNNNTGLSGWLMGGLDGLANFGYNKPVLAFFDWSGEEKKMAQAKEHMQEGVVGPEDASLGRSFERTQESLESRPTQTDPSMEEDDEEVAKANNGGRPRRAPLQEEEDRASTPASTQVTRLSLEEAQEEVPVKKTSRDDYGHVPQRRRQQPPPPREQPRQPIPQEPETERVPDEEGHEIVHVDSCSTSRVVSISSIEFPTPSFLDRIESDQEDDYSILGLEKKSTKAGGAKQQQQQPKKNRDLLGKFRRRSFGSSSRSKKR
eukprot:Nitzschia sp. Nitz4//scaffold16_size188269//10874//13531//NITZ4_001766-RA/size188269-processed-gene-0.37-mRNA-1//-1//CDS//3329538440//1244//frame0